MAYLSAGNPELVVTMAVALNLRNELQFLRGQHEKVSCDQRFICPGPSFMRLCVVRGLALVFHNHKPAYILTPLGSLYVGSYEREKIEGVSAYQGDCGPYTITVPTDSFWKELRNSLILKHFLQHFLTRYRGATPSEAIHEEIFTLGRVKGALPAAELLSVRWTDNNATGKIRLTVWKEVLQQLKKPSCVSVVAPWILDYYLYAASETPFQCDSKDAQEIKRDVLVKERVYRCSQEILQQIISNMTLSEK